MAKDEWDLPDEPGGRSLDDLDRALDQDFDIDPANDTRSPVTKFSSSIRDEMMSIRAASSFVKRVGYESLPKDYKDAYKNYDDVTDEVGKLYDHAKKEAKPAIDAAKRAGRAIVPGLEKFLPKSVYDKLQGLVAEDEQRSGSDPEEMEIASTLSGIFEAQQQNAEAQAKIQEGRDKTRLEEGKKQFEASLGVSNQIASGISRLVGYQDNVLVKYQRKSLELQHRQYFATRQLLEVTRTTSEMLTNGVQTIVHNTGLPNEAKAAKMSEVWFQESKKRLFGSAYDSMHKRLGNLPKKMAKNLKEQITGAMQGASMGMEGIADMAEMARESGGASSAAGMMAGARGRQWVEDKAIKRLAPWLENNETVKKGGNLLSLFGSNFFRAINEQTKKGQSGEGNFFQRTLFNLLGPAEEEDTITAFKGLDENQMTPVSWDILSRRTLIEVIPGFLGKILKQATMANYLSNKMVESFYPDDKRIIKQVYFNKLNRIIPELTFSLQQERFITVRQKQQRIMKDLSTVLTGSSMNRVQEQLLKEIIGKKERVTPVVQQEISRLMMQDSLKGLTFNPYRFSNLTARDTPFHKEINALFRSQYAGVIELFDPETSKADVARLLKEMSTEDSEKLRKSSDQFNKFRSVAGESQAVLNKASAEDLYALGLTNKSTGEFGEGLLALMNEYALRGHGIDTPEKAKAFSAALAEKDPEKQKAILERIGFNLNPVVPATPERTTPVPKNTRQNKNSRQDQQASQQRQSGPTRGKGKGAGKRGAQGKYYGGLVEYLAGGGSPGGIVDPNSASLTNTQDTVPTMLQEGEFVIPRHIVDRYGVEFFNNISNIEQGKPGMMKRLKRAITPKGGMMLSHAEQQTMLLSRIAKAVEHGYIATPGGEVMQYGYFGAAGADMKKVLNEGWKKAKGLVTGAKDLAKKSYDTFKEKIFNPALAFGKDKGGKLADWSKNKFKEGKEWVTDLYVEGSNGAQLLYSKLKAGKYYVLNDKGEKTFFTTWKELANTTSDIYDSDTDTIIVRKEDIEKLRAKTSAFINSVKGFFSGLKDKATDLFNFSANAGIYALRFVKTMGKKAYRGIKKKLNEPVDVYVQGKIDQGPRLRKLLFINKAYIDAQGKVISHQDKINGPVFTTGPDGKPVEALSQEDITAGLVELDGTPITGSGLTGRLYNKAKNYIGKGIAAGKKIASKAWEVGKKVGGAVLDTVGIVGQGIAGALPGLGFSSGIEQRLDRIIKHMRIIHPLSAADVAIIDREIPRSKMSAQLREKWKEWKLKDKAKGQWDKIKETELAQKLKDFKDKAKGKKDTVVNKANEMKEKAKAAKNRAKELWNKRLDADGDGFIKGSWQEIQKQREERKKAKEAAKIGPPRPGGEDKGVGKLLGGLKDLMNMLMFPIRGIGKMIMGLAAIIPGAATLLKLATAPAKALSFVAKGVGSIFRSQAARTVGGIAARQGGRMAATAAITMGGPVVWAVAGMAAIGFAAWKGYQYYKKKKNLSPLTKLRFLQYGLPEVGGKEANDPFSIIKQATKAYFGKEDARVVIHYLEDWCNDNISVDDNGSFTPPKKEDVWSKFHKDFDCDEDNTEHQRNFGRWFFKRFLPVYVWHVLAARNTGKCTIQDADDKVPVKKKAEYVKKVQFGKLEAIKLGIDPYTILSSPWPNTTLVTNREVIKTLSEAITEASNAGTDLNPEASKLIDAKQNKMTKDLKNESKIVKKNTFGRFLRDISLRAIGQDKKADELLIEEKVREQKTGKELMKNPPKFKPGQASVNTVKEAKELQELLFAQAQAAGLEGEELAVFMANMHHETMGFKRFQENFNYKPEALLATFPKRIKNIEEARKLVQGGPMAIANHIYGNMLGNSGPTDGYAFSGKGYIQLTGRENYEAAGKALGLDLVNNPNLALDPNNAAKIALWFWKSRGISDSIKGAGSFQEKMIIARKRINGNRMLGLEDTAALSQEYNKWVADKWVAKSNEVKAPAKKMANSNQEVAKAEAKVAQEQQQKKPDAATAAGGQVATATPAPVINVAAPNLDSVNETSNKVGSAAAQQREQQIQQSNRMIEQLVQLNNALLASQKSGTPMPTTQVQSVLDVSRQYGV